MTSMLCHKQPGGQVHVHDSGLVEGLMFDGNDSASETILSKESSAGRRRRHRPNTTPSPSRNMDSSSLIGQTMRVQHWLNEKTVKNLQEKSDLETQATRKLYSPLLQTESSFVRDVEDFIHNRELTTLRKKEVLHKKWNERVYKPLRKKIIEAMDSHDWPEVDRRKRELHKQYLEFVNEKGHVFLDTMDPEEYYAMALNGHRPAPIKRRGAKTERSLEGRRTKEEEMQKEVKTVEKLLINRRVETRPLHDPLISQGRERNEEDRTILRCLTGYRYSDKDIEQVKLPAMPLVPLGRHGTDSIRWLQMPLSNIESTPRMASRKRMDGSFNVSKIDFDAWAKTKYNHDDVDKELQIQKKRQYSEDQTPPFPKPLVRRAVSLRPSVHRNNISYQDLMKSQEQKNVSFQEPLVTQVMAVDPVSMSGGKGNDIPVGIE